MRKPDISRKAPGAVPASVEEVKVHGAPSVEVDSSAKASLQARLDRAYSVVEGLPAVSAADCLLVGAWLWLYAPGPVKLSPEVVEALQGAEWRWNAGRRCWQYAGVSAPRSRAGSRWVLAKYGARKLRHGAGSLRAAAEEGES